MSHTTRRTVLLIEEDASLRRLLALGLQYRGIQVIEASSPAQLPAMQGQQPDLLLLDIDGGVKSDWSLLTGVQSYPSLATLPKVVLAWENVLPADVYRSTTQTHTTCLTKPFDARALYATIEQLLLQTEAQEVLRIAQIASPAPSIWPVITAAALLLTVIGLMVHITITVVGILILLIALLGWTLGTKPETVPVPKT